jgi:acetate kinase
MANADPTRILTINAGSSSLKAAVYDMERTERTMFGVQVERISHDRQARASPAVDDLNGRH